MTTPLPGPRPAPPKGVPAWRRAEIMQKYARIYRGRWPMRCGPAWMPAKDRKIIFDSQADAEAAEAELRAAGNRPQRAYLCERSRTGHYHLTSDLVGKGKPS